MKAIGVRTGVPELSRQSPPPNKPKPAGVDRKWFLLFKVFVFVLIYLSVLVMASITVMKHRDQKQLWKELVYFSLQPVVHHP
jgi:heme/copper-type cytochrome/quinol oxidase subunit 2